MRRSEKAEPPAPPGEYVAEGDSAAPSPIGRSGDPALDLEGSIVVLLTMLSNQISASGSLTFQTRHGLTSPEWKVMAVIGAMPGSSGMEIAQVLSLDKAAISRTMQALTRRGLIRIERSDRGNFRAAYFSEEGRMVHAAGLETAAEREQCLLSDLSQEQRTVLHDLLRTMMKRMPHVFHLADAPAGAEPQAAHAAVPLVVDTPAGGDQELRDRVGRLESLLADVMLENVTLRRRST